jgi:hypothetical protein
MGSIRNIISHFVIGQILIEVGLIGNLGRQVPDLDDMKLAFRGYRNAN